MDDSAWISGLNEPVDFMVDEGSIGSMGKDFSMKTQKDKFLGGNASEKTKTSRPDIGQQIKDAGKDVSRFTRKPLWNGSFSEFVDNIKKAPTDAIQQQLDPTETYAYRAIGGKELQGIITADGIGGEGYQGVNYKDGTLFALNLQGAPLSMMDGRNYGGQDDRSNNGYIIAVRKSDVLPHANNPDSEAVLNVNTKIPLEKLHALFRVDRNQPTYKTPDDTQFTYQISQIVPKPNPQQP